MTSSIAHIKSILSSTTRLNVLAYVSPYCVGALSGGVVLFFYLVAVRAGVYWPIAAFWGSLALVIAVLVGQVFSFRAHENQLNWVLPVLLLLVWLIKTIFVPVSVPFFGSDAYVEQAATLEIARAGWLELSPWAASLSQWPQSTNYPLLSAISLTLTQPIGLPLAGWVRWAMPAISLISLSLVHAISQEIYRSRRVALLGSIGFGLTYMFLMFHSLYLRETLALTLFLAAVYAVSKTRFQSDDLFYRVAALLCCLGVVFAHHLTAFLLLLFILLLLLTRSLAGVLPRWRYVQFNRTERVSAVLWLFLLVALVTYWAYLRRSPLQIMHLLAEEALYGAETTSFALPATARYNILLYSQTFTTLCFGLLAVYGFLSSKSPRNIFQASAILWGGLAGSSSLLFAVAGIKGTSSLASRFELFGYAFLLPAAAYGAIHLARQRRWWTLPLGLLFVLYGLNSIYRIPPYLYSPSRPDFARGEVRSVLLPEEYNLMTRIETGAQLNVDGGLYRWVRPLAVIAENGKVRLADTNPSSWVAFDFFITGERASKSLPQDPGLSRLYRAGTASVYAPMLSRRRSFQIDDLLLPATAGSEAITSPGWGPGALFVLEMSLIGLGAIGLARSFRLADLSLGIVLVFLAIFAVYLGANLAGYRSPGLFVLPALVGLAGLGLRSLKRHPSVKYVLPAGVVAGCLLLFGYGPGVDFLSKQYVIQPYTEFYVESIGSCNQDTCVKLRLVNREGRPMAYGLDGQQGPITLGPDETWQGTVVLTREFAARAYLINLYKSSGSILGEALVLRFADGP